VFRIGARRRRGDWLDSPVDSSSRGVDGHYFRDSLVGWNRETECGVRVRLTILLPAITSSVLLVMPTVLPASVTALAAHAREASAAADAEVGAEQPPERSMVGTLDQVDDQATEFVVKTASGKQRFLLQSDATIRQGSKTIKASELAAHKGERVKVRYRESAGERRAEWIVVASPPSHKVKTDPGSLR
jgi:hypothetical protein